MINMTRREAIKLCKEVIANMINHDMIGHDEQDYASYMDAKGEWIDNLRDLREYLEEGGIS